MKLKFNNQEFILSHWKTIGSAYFRELYRVEPTIFKTRSVGPSLSWSFTTYYHRISLEPLFTSEKKEYIICGTGFLEDAVTCFIKTNGSFFNLKEIEKTKMDITNFLIKYNKLKSFT